MYRVCPVPAPDLDTGTLHAVYHGAALIAWCPDKSDAERVAGLLEADDEATADSSASGAYHASEALIAD